MIKRTVCPSMAVRKLGVSRTRPPVVPNCATKTFAPSLRIATALGGADRGTEPVTDRRARSITSTRSGPAWVANAIARVGLTTRSR